MTDADALPADSYVGRVALRVNDLDALVDFYADAVGLSVLERTESRATLGAGDESLLVLHEDPDAPARGLEETGLFHAAFRVPDRGALADALARVRDGWELTGASDHRVSEALYLRDPEDNGVEIYRDRPRGEWPTTADGRVEMDTLPLDLADLAAERAESEREARAPAGTTVGHVHLEVSSIPRSRSVYVDALGLAVRQEWGDEALFVAAGDYHHHVGLNAWNGRSAPPRGRGLSWFELVVPDEASLTATKRRLEAADATVEPSGDGFDVVDPDGIRLRVRVASQT